MIEQCNAFMRDLQTKNIEKITEWFDEESIVNIPPLQNVTGAKRISILFRAIFKKYQNLNWSVKEIIPINKNRGLYFTYSSGIKLCGNNYTNEIVTEIVFTDCGKKIKYRSDYFKITPA